MNTTQIGLTNQQTNSLLTIIVMPVVFLCALASFRYDHFKLINDWDDRGNILTRGAAVLISPLVCALALGKNVGPVFGNATYVYLLVAAAFILDFRINAAAYQNNDAKFWAKLRRSFWPIISRLALMGVMVSIATYAALLAEQPNLMKSLRTGESQQALGNQEIRQIDDQIVLHQQTILDNEKRLQVKVTLENERIENLRYADNEKDGIGGIDQKTGRKLVGFGCGPRCKEYKNNADAAAQQIAVLDDVQDKNVELQRQVAKLKADREKLLDQYLSDENSAGSLFKAWEYADDGLKAKIIANGFLLVFLDLFALIIAHLPVSEGMRDAIADIKREDAQRRRCAHELRSNEMMADQAKARSKLSASLPPIVVQIPAKRASSNGAQAAPKTEQVQPNRKASNDDPMGSPKDVI